MGIPLTVFSLYRLDGDGCSHHLLVRVRQPGFSNADAGAYDHAVQVAEARRSALVGIYRTDILPRECTAPHRARLVSEMQAAPVGDELDEASAGAAVGLWVAQTGYGAPWVVMGTAESEAAFWRAVEEDDDLSGLRPLRPAVRLRAFFLAGSDEDSDGVMP